MLLVFHYFELHSFMRGTTCTSGSPHVDLEIGESGDVARCDYEVSKAHEIVVATHGVN